MGDSIFARYLSHLDRCGELRDRRLFDEMWIALRRALRRELTRRDLWRLPPGYLGIYGFGSWNEEALDDLVQDCYLFVIHERQRSLTAHSRVRQDIDGLILLNVRNFLFETQRKHDPLGFRIFELIQLAARKNLEGGTCRIIAGDRRIRNNTIMDFSTHESDGPEASHRTAPMRSPDEPGVATDPTALRSLAVSWCDELLPELVTLRGPAVTEFVKRLQNKLRKVSELGIGRLRFGDLVDAVKTEARARWAAISTLDMQVANPVVERDGSTHTDIIQREQYRLLLDGLEAAVHAWPGRNTTRDYLSRLLTFLCHHAAESDTPDRLPSFRRLSEALDIPRERFKKLFATLRQLAEDNRESSELPPPGRLSAHFFNPETLNERASP